MPFPPFSDYQETFSAPLPPSIFTTFTVPPWVPTPSQLTRIARVIYPYWRERRTERGGHRIISVLNVSCCCTILCPRLTFLRSSMKLTRRMNPIYASDAAKLKQSAKPVLPRSLPPISSFACNPSSCHHWSLRKMF
jgi:enhancer of polycomb-like protein